MITKNLEVTAASTPNPMAYAIVNQKEEHELKKNTWHRSWLWVSFW